MHRLMLEHPLGGVASVSYLALNYVLGPEREHLGGNRDEDFADRLGWWEAFFVERDLEGFPRGHTGTWQS